MPVIDELAAEYGDRIDFVAPAWKSTPEATFARGNELLQSGKIFWGLDEEEEVFSAYGVPYQPVTVLIAHDRTVVTEWAGMQDPAEIEAWLNELIALAG